MESLRPKRLPSVARRGFRFGVVEAESTAFPLPFFNVAPRDVSAPSDGLLRSLSAERLVLPRSLEDRPPELAPGDADPVVVAGARSQGGWLGIASGRSIELVLARESAWKYGLAGANEVVVELGEKAVGDWETGLYQSAVDPRNGDGADDSVGGKG